MGSLGSGFRQRMLLLGLDGELQLESLVIEVRFGTRFSDEYYGPIWHVMKESYGSTFVPSDTHKKLDIIHKEDRVIERKM